MGDRHRAFRYKDSVQQISRFLYPDDSTEDGRRLRLMQEYFFVSAASKVLSAIIRKNTEKVSIVSTNTLPSTSTIPIRLWSSPS